MRRALPLLCLAAGLLGAAGPARAQTAESYLLPCAFPSDRTCRETATSFKREFNRAMAGDLEGVRAISVCLATTCGGVIIENRIQACAWRLLTVGAKPSRAEDAAFFKTYCRDRLSTAELTLAGERARFLSQRVFHRPLVAFGF